MSLAIALIFGIPFAIMGIMLIHLFHLISKNHFGSRTGKENCTITIQDGKGNMLINETLLARANQRVCKHHWILTGGIYECPDCYCTKHTDE